MPVPLTRSRRADSRRADRGEPRRSRPFECCTR